MHTGLHKNEYSSSFFTNLEVYHGAERVTELIRPSGAGLLCVDLNMACEEVGAIPFLTTDEHRWTLIFSTASKQGEFYFFCLSSVFISVHQWLNAFFF
jgi:hypothetical protein